MKQQPTLSIIIANWNGIEDLKISLPSINSQSYTNYEVILVDNWSTDWSIEYAKKTIHNIKIIELKKNNGFAWPNNKGYEVSNWKYILTLNNDIELTSNFINNAVDYLDNSTDDVYAINTKMLLYSDKSKINTIWIWILKNWNWYNIWKWEDQWNYQEVVEIFWPCAWAAFYKKSAIKKLWYFFDETYFAYLEDLDLAIRARINWYKAFYFPEAVCYHKHGNTSKRFPLKKYYLIERNRLRNLIKYYPLKNIIFESYYSLEFVYKWIMSSKWWETKIDKQQKQILKNVFWLILIIIKSRFTVLLELPSLIKYRKSQKKIYILKNYIYEK